MRARRVTIFGLLAVAVAAAAALLAHSFSPARAAKPVPSSVERPTVRAAVVTSAPATVEQWYYGTTRSVRRAVLSFSTAGRLSAREVSVGSYVQAGQLLARLDALGLVHAVEQQQASLDTLEARLRFSEQEDTRIRSLAGMKGVSASTAERVASEADSLRASRAAARVGLEEARRSVNESVLRAPFSGWVSSVWLETGEFASPGRAVLALEGDGTAEIELQVTEGTIGALQVGSQVSVDLPLAGVSGLNGVISTIGGAAPERSRLYPVVITLPKADHVRHGMTARVRLQIPSGAALVVPMAAIISRTGEDAHLWRMRGDVVEKVPVKIGSILDGNVSVSGPISKGDRVVIAGHVSLLAGDQVQALP